MGRLDGKVAIVTGGARGQGAAEARRFAEEGAKVVVTDVLDDEGEAVAKEIGDTALYLHHDVTDEAQWEGVVARTVDHFGDVHVLVNNAGIAKFTPIAMTSLDDYMDVVNVNQVGVFLGMKHVVPAMSTSVTRTGLGGSILNISSVDGMVGMIGVVAYVASKWAVRGMTKTAAIEFGGLGIRVNSIHPGGIDTPMLTEPTKDLPGVDLKNYFSRVPAGRIGTPEDVAELALFLASDESAYCTGSEFVVDGGLIAGFGAQGLLPE
ncbi:MAG TPA: glucose 1-dehydrogenase [Acidimicrobiia bacterium]|nr:glucose 1-dehydrogenase [Acidimicrobiia bacterium]